MILHIPHASTIIPERFLSQFELSGEELARERLCMTDMYTDQLFALSGTTTVAFPYSRLLVDVERFRSDDSEPMSKVGMAKFYSQTAAGKPLRRPLSEDEEAERLALYDAHHAALDDAVAKELSETGAASIVDCHSFPSTPLPCDQSQSSSRPDFCIGTDAFHTDPGLVQAMVRVLDGRGHSVGIDSPYAGTIVPMRYFRKDRRVNSIMIEVNRRLYMDEASGSKNEDFGRIQGLLVSVLQTMRQW